MSIKKVCLVSSFSGDTGASHSLIVLSDKLTELGYKVIVVIPKEGFVSRELKKRNISFKIIKSYPWVIDIKKRKKYLEKIKWIIKKTINFFGEIRLTIYIKKNQISLVHINALTSEFGRQSAKICNLPLIWHIREFVDKDLNKVFWNKKKFLKSLHDADAIIAISESIRNNFLTEDLKNRFFVVYNGIETGNLEIVVKPIFSEEKFVQFLILGRVTPKKGQLEAVMMIADLKNKVEQKIELLLVGEIQDKDYGREIEKFIIENNLKENVKIMGHRSNPQDFLSECDIVLIPSYFEAFGRVTIEGQLYERLVMGTNTGGTKELILDGKTGYLFDVHNKDEFSRSVSKVLQNTKLAYAVAKKGKEKALSMYTAEKNAENIAYIYSKVLSKRRETN